jgi:hypothetical protein
MLRPILKKLVQLLSSLFQDAGDDRNGDRADHADDQGSHEGDSPAADPDDGASETPTGPSDDPPADGGSAYNGKGSDTGESSESESNLNRSVDEELDLDGMQNPCVGSDRWDHAPAMPTPPEDPDATINVLLWPEMGSDDVRAGCEMAASHLEYVILEAWGDQYDVNVTVSEETVPEYIKDRAGFKEYARNEADRSAAEHINVHVGTDGPAGTACCGWGFVNAEDYFEGISWDPASNCVKRRRAGSTGYGLSAVIHEALHCVGISHTGDDAWLKKATVDIQGTRHSPIMGTSYVGIKTNGWHLIELHPDNDQRPELA